MPELETPQAEANPDTVLLMYEVAREQLAEQSENWERLDAKAFQLLAAGGVILGVAGLGFPGWMPWLAGAVIAFLALAAASLSAAWVRDYLTPFAADRLLTNHWFEQPDVLRYAVLHTAALQSIPANRKALAGKAKLVTGASLAFAAEALFIGLWAMSGV